MDFDRAQFREVSYLFHYPKGTDFTGIYNSWQVQLELSVTKNS
jgi:hypothetical protein